jgi:hypothetical protein
MAGAFGVEQSGEPSGGDSHRINPQLERRLSEVLDTDVSEIKVSSGSTDQTFGSHVQVSSTTLTFSTPAEQSILAHEMAHALHRTADSEAGFNDVDELEAVAEAAAATSLFQAIGARWAERFVSDEAKRRVRTRPRLLHCEMTKLAPIPDPATSPSYQDWLAHFPPMRSSGLRRITSATPTDLRALIATQHGVPPDCADVSLVLRHYYLKAQNQPFEVKVGPGHGKPFKIGAGVDDAQLGKVLLDVGTINFQEDRAGFRFAKFYKAAGVRISNLKGLLAAGLKPGDLLVWKRLSTAHGNFEGHVQTVQEVDRAAGTLTVVQGNMRAGVGVGELEQKKMSFSDLTGAADGDATIKATPEEEFFGAGPWQ